MENMIECTSEALWDNFLAKMTDNQLRAYSAACEDDNKLRGESHVFNSQESFVFSRMAIAQRILSRKAA
jgi:hypothetical protein